MARIPDVFCKRHVIFFVPLELATKKRVSIVEQLNFSVHLWFFINTVLRRLVPHGRENKENALNSTGLIRKGT